MSPRTVVYRTTIAKTVKVRNKVCFHSHYRVFQIDIKSAFILIYIYTYILVFLFIYIYFVFLFFPWLNIYRSLLPRIEHCVKNRNIYIYSVIVGVEVDFASDYDNITTDKRNTIIHAKNSILIHKHLPWQKKGNTTFDVTMGSYDSAEICELEGSFLLSQLQDLNINVGIYRDDGLAITNATPRVTENIKKEICRIFNNNCLRITIEANKQIIIFLDVTFNLNRSTYQPFTKPNTSLQYVHRESNHPPITIKNIPPGINKRL